MSPISNQLPAEHELQAFVDSIESGVVKLLLQDAKGEWHGHLLPEAVLPPNTKEGSWLRLGIAPIDPPPGMDPRPVRRSLSETDTGEDFSL
jgi:hypothetical protein